MKAKPHILALVLAIFGTSVGSRSLQAQQEVLEELRQVAIIDEKIMVPIRDGVRLATDVFPPPDRGARSHHFFPHPLQLQCLARSGDDHSHLSIGATRRAQRLCLCGPE